MSTSLPALESLLPPQFLDLSSILGTQSSEDDDFLYCLTLSGEPEKNWAMAGSPDSTLGGMETWWFSPQTKPCGAANDTWDHIARLNIKKTSNYQDEKELLGPARIQNQDGILRNKCFGHSSWQLNQYQQQHQVRLDQVLKQKCYSKQQVKQAAGWQVQPHNQQIQNRGTNIVGRPLGLPQSAWPLLQPNNNKPQQQSSASAGTRAVSLNGSGIKREYVGTGVFLPRTYGNDTPEYHSKKSDCTSVLLPAKPIDALNLNLEDMNMQGNPQSRFKIDLASDYDTLMAKRYALLAQQNRNLYPDQYVLNREIQLPQEWIY